MRQQLTSHLKALGVAIALAASQVSFAALKTAAVEPGGTSGFASAVTFLNNIATYLIYLAVPAGTIGLIVGGIMLVSGSPDGPKWLARTGIGVAVVLLSKGLMA